MQKFQFELVSPERKLISELVTMAVVPGEEGDFGVLSGHAPLISTVRTGVITIYRDSMDVVSERIFVAGGFADVTGENCTVLAEQAIPVNDIDTANIQLQIAETKTELTAVARGGVDERRLTKRLGILNEMLMVKAA